MKNIFIVSGPAGSGKDSIIDGLAAHLPIERIITTTTRAPRPGESEGRPYYFLSPEMFEAQIRDGAFIEHSINENGGRYGVTRSELDRIIGRGSIAIWRVDWKGVDTIKKIHPEIPAIYISAPLAVLEARLRARDRGKDETYFRERMAYTREWLKHTDIYDYQVENEEGKLSEAVAKVKTIIESHLEK
jgi:guanylate kinase